MVLCTYRYMWKVEGSDSVNFKIVTDVDEGLEQFEKAVLELEGLESFAKEYLHSYDVSRVGVFQKIYQKEVQEV